MHYSVHCSLLSGSTGCLERTGRIVEPYVHALNHTLCEGDVISRDEDDAAEEPVLLGDFNDLLDEVLSGSVGRMGLAGEDELYRALRVVHDLSKPVKVAEEQGCSLVGGETTGKTDGQGIVAEPFLDGDNLLRSIVGAELRIRESLLDSLGELTLHLLAGLPNFLIGNGVDALKAALVVMVGCKLVSEDLGVNLLPVPGCPGRIVHSVGDIADIEFLRKISRIHVRENLLAHLAVKHGYAVDILGHIGGEGAH